MKNLSLTEEELEVLKQVMKSDLSSIWVEISHTDTLEFKEYLKGRESTMRSILTKLETT